MAAINEGTAVQIDTRPDFSGFLNTSSKSTSKHRLMEELEGESGVQEAIVLNDLQDDLDATLVLKTSTTLPAAGDVLTTTTGSVKYLVLEVGRPFTAGLSKKVELKLKKSEGVTL